MISIQMLTLSVYLAIGMKRQQKRTRVNEKIESKTFNQPLAQFVIANGSNS